MYEPVAGIQVVHDKTRYDAFEGTQLLQTLKEKGYSIDVVCG